MIRSYRDGDAAGVAALLRASAPPELYVMSPAGIAHRIGHEPERAHQRVWVAEAGGAVVGWARARFRWEAADAGIGRVEVEVARAERRRGLGGELLARAEAHLVAHGAWKIDATVLGDADGLRFARAHGYVETRRELCSWLEPRPVEVAVPAAVRLLRLGSLQDRLREVWQLEAASIADVPADSPNTRIGFDEWVAETLEHPDLSREGSIFAEVEGRLAAHTLVSVDLDRGLAWNEMTGTAPEFRRRGLARLVKLASIAWAARAGIRCLSTGNDSTNAAMLALNRELGYRPLVDGIEVAKLL